MSHKKHVLFTMALVMIAVVALSVSTAFAGDFATSNPPVIGDEHPPVCYRIETFIPGAVGLECIDTGKDIVNVNVKTNAKYELHWNAERVILTVYPAEKGTAALWSVRDKNGSVVSGELH